MRSEKKTSGVVATHNNRFWGRAAADAPYTWGILQDARISNPKYCRCATDMTYIGSPVYAELAQARLVTVRVTTIYETE